jgi:hypothetical protein
MYDSPFTTRNITTICSGYMGTHIRRLFDVSFLCFEDWSRMNETFPQLEILGIIGHTVTGKMLQEHEYAKTKYGFFEKFLPISRNQVEMLRWFRDEARFQTFINTAVAVNYFEDNSRDIERYKVSVHLRLKNDMFNAYPILTM